MKLSIDSNLRGVCLGAGNEISAFYVSHSADLALKGTLL